MQDKYILKKAGKHWAADSIPDSVLLCAYNYKLSTDLLLFDKSKWSQQLKSLAGW